MKRLTTIPLLLFSFILNAQAGVQEPGYQDSYSNKDLILLSLAGLGVLIAVYFLFRRAKKRRNSR